MEKDTIIAIIAIVSGAIGLIFSAFHTWFRGNNFRLLFIFKGQ